MDANKKMNKFDIDIEIKDLIWEFIRRWRVIVVLAVVCGIGLAAYQYNIDVNKTVVATVKKNQEELEASMGKQDLDEVTAAVALKRQADERSAYMENSELMKINPYEENVVFIQYYVNAESMERAEDIHEAYVTYVNQGSLGSELVSIVKESDTAYYNAKSASDRASYTIESGLEEQVFSVKVIGSTVDAAATLAEDVKTKLQEYAAMVMNNIGAHQLTLVQEVSAVVADQELAELQNWNATAIKTICNNLDSMKNEMTGDQISLYTYRTTVTDVTTNSTTSNTAAPAEKVVTISVKHAVIGVIVGVVLACAWIFVSYLFAAALRNAEEVKALYQVAVIGTIDDSKYQKKKVFAFIDNLILKLQNCRKKKLTYEQELQMVGANVALDCAKAQKKEVLLTSSATENLPEAIVKDIVAKCEEKGISVKLGGMLSYDAEALEAAANIGSVVFVEKKHVSLYDELYDEVALCKSHGIHVVGMVVIGV